MSSVMYRPARSKRSDDYLMQRPGDGRRRSDPSPDEIAAACREIQAGWSESERASRQVGHWPARLERLAEVVDSARDQARVA